ncbi:hypothetical protein BE08_03905 [Sorangium cellulosum]|uniref:Secreted protein n=1 Tax=Sorangium cellulosum TaxID=56 RepID=A0A150PIM3_SORCE|nr:hypothetical protein BE08_03905 [Sorangium cellulosum]
MSQQHSTRALLPLIILAASACSGAKPKQAGEDYNFEQAYSDEAAPAETESSSDAEASASEDSGGGLNDDQKKQMEIALRRGGDKASNCAEVVPNAPTGEGEVKVVFDGQKGRVTDVLVGPPFAGTPAEACVKRAFVGEIVLPFDGDPLEVPYTVKLPAKKAGSAASSTKKP